MEVLSGAAARTGKARKKEYMKRFNKKKEGSIVKK